MIYYSDSHDNPTMTPDVLEHALGVVTKSQFRNPKMVPHYLRALQEMADDQHADQVYTALSQKSYPENTVFGPKGLVYSLCEAVEYGYGLFPNSGDAAMINWLGPQMYFQQERLIFKVINWKDYVRNVGQRGSGKTWTCTPKAFTDVAPTGCEFNYCFEPDRHSFFGVPAGVRPSDVMEACKTEAIYNILGQRITDRTQLREYLLMKGLAETQIDTLFTGDWTAATAGNNGQEDGLFKFFENWTTRHSYLSQACLDNFAPVTTAIPTTAAGLSTLLGVTVADNAGAINEGKFNAFVKILTDHIQKIEWLVSDIDNGNYIDFNDLALVMSAEDAMYVNYVQFCQTKCAPATFSITDYSQINAFYTEFQAKFRSGQYGGGVLRLNDGREISIMQMRRQPKGGAMLLVKGWAGPNPNTYGLRIAAMQYNSWYSEAQKVSPNFTTTRRLVLNGTGVRYEPADECADLEVRYNWRLFSNAPWLQLRITGLPTNSITRSEWPTLPALPKYTVCTPN